MNYGLSLNFLNHILGFLIEIRYIGVLLPVTKIQMIWNWNVFKIRRVRRVSLKESVPNVQIV